MKNQGRSQKAGTSESNRSTSSNVWKPPPSEGTTSPQRALRWQAANQEETVSPRGEQPSPDDRSEKSTKSGSTNQTSGTQSTSKASSKKKKKGKEQVIEDEGPKGPGEVDWYGDPLVPGIDASLGPGGSLYSFTKNHGPRAGMCNPPMNPAVRAALVADLNNWEVAPTVKSKKDKKENEEANEKNALRRKIIVPPAGASALRQDEASAEMSAGDSSWGASASLPAGGFMGGSAGSSRISSPGNVMRRSASMTSHPHRGGSPFVRPRKKKGETTWQLDLTQEGKTKKPGLDTAPEPEVKMRLAMVRRQSREHGFVLEKMEVEHLGHLSTYHNKFSRGPLQHPPPPIHPVYPSRQLKDLSVDMHSTSQSLNSVSDVTIHNSKRLLLSELGSPTIQSRTRDILEASQEAPSMERLMELANGAKHWAPHKLQSMCEKSRISVHTGAKLPLSGATQCLDDDPLLSGRLGATPRTRSGKPLPVPYWGRNGSAPVLREAPEIRQARAAAEAAR